MFLAVVLFSVITVQAYAAGPELTAGTPTGLMARQIPLTILAARIHGVVDRENLVGYAGDEFDIPNLSLILYWHGPVPAHISQLLAQLPSGVSAAVRPSNYSLRELDAEERRLASGDVSAVGADVVSVAPSRDYNGLDVSVFTQSNVALPHLNTSFPVHVTRSAKGQPLDGRQSAASPYPGGAVIRRTDFFGEHTCSTGFAARTSGGSVVMLTDQHCGQNQTWFNGDYSNTVGSSNNGVGSVDSMYLSGQSYNGGIFVGAWNSASRVSVSAALRPSMNQYICYGGGLSGEVCNNVVMSVNVFRMGRGPGFQTYQLNSQGAVGEGDSGGPAYGYDGMGGGGAVAFGLINQGIVGDEASCTGVGGRTCYWGAFSTNIGDVLSAQGLSIVQAHAHLTNVFSNRCLDADTTTIYQNGTKVQLWDCTGAAWQSWYFPGDGTIRNVFSGRCLETDPAFGGANGTKLILWDCNGGGNQAWIMLGDGLVRSWAYGRCVDADTNTIYHNGTKMQLWDCTGANWQRWYWT